MRISFLPGCESKMLFNFYKLITTRKENHIELYTSSERIFCDYLKEAEQISNLSCYSYNSLKNLLKRVTEFKPDVLILKERTLQSLILALYAKLHKCKVLVVTDIGLYISDKHARRKFYNTRRWFFDLIFSDGFICNTFSAYIYHSNKQHNACFVPYTIFKSVDKLKLHNDRVRFIFVGRLVAEKNLIKLINCDAFSDGNAELIVIGDGPLKENVINASKSKNIIFRGSMTNDQVLNEINKSDMLVLQSCGDTFGIPIMEALSLGVPVICSTMTGVHLSHVVDNYNGYVVNYNDDINELIKNYCNDKQLRDRLKCGASTSMLRYNDDSLALTLYKFVSIYTNSINRDHSENRSINKYDFSNEPSHEKVGQ